MRVHMIVIALFVVLLVTVGWLAYATSPAGATTVPVGLAVFAQMAQIATGFATVYVLVWSLFHTSHVSHTLKKADVFIECNRKFDQLLVEYPHIQNERDAMGFYERFWSLQRQQFEFWRNGLIPDEQYESWMLARRRDFSDVSSSFFNLGGKSFLEAWQQVRVNFEVPIPKFTALINSIHSGMDVKVAMRNAKV